VACQRSGLDWRGIHGGELMLRRLRRAFKDSYGAILWVEYLRSVVSKRNEIDMLSCIGGRANCR